MLVRSGPQIRAISSKKCFEVEDLPLTLVKPVFARAQLLHKPVEFEGLAVELTLGVFQRALASRVARPRIGRRR